MLGEWDALEEKLKEANDYVAGLHKVDIVVLTKDKCICSSSVFMCFLSSEILMYHRLREAFEQ